MTANPIKISAAERKLLREICYQPKETDAHIVAAKQLISKGLAKRDSMRGALCPTPKGHEVNELSE